MEFNIWLLRFFRRYRFDLISCSTVCHKFDFILKFGVNQITGNICPKSLHFSEFEYMFYSLRIWFTLKNKTVYRTHVTYFMMSIKMQNLKLQFETVNESKKNKRKRQRQNSRENVKTEMPYFFRNHFFNDCEIQ
jgi:hypothetical protein